MQKTIIFIFSIFTFNIIGQVDSSIYFKYKKDPDVTKVKYSQTFYSNKIIKQKGWVVSYKNAATSKIFKITNADPNMEYHLKTGIWYGYYKDGKRKYIDSSYNTEFVSGNIYCKYNKRGQLVEKYYNSNQKIIDKKNTIVLFGPAYEKSSNKALGDSSTIIYYFDNGQIHYIVNYFNNKPTGIDRYYNEKGELTKEVNHNNP